MRNRSDEITFRVPHKVLFKPSESDGRWAVTTFGDERFLSDRLPSTDARDFVRWIVGGGPEFAGADVVVSKLPTPAHPRQWFDQVQDEDEDE